MGTEQVDPRATWPRQSREEAEIILLRKLETQIYRRHAQEPRHSHPDHDHCEECEILADLDAVRRTSPMKNHQPRLEGEDIINLQKIVMAINDWSDPQLYEFLQKAGVDTSAFDRLTPK